MKNYLDLLRKIMAEGVTVQTGACLPSEGNRKPTARRLHGEQLRFDLRHGFPAVTTKPLWWRAVCAEFIWFMRGSGDGQYLIDQKVDSIWRAWFKDGTTDLGPCYPVQFRRQQGVEWRGRPDVQPDVDADTLERTAFRSFRSDDEEYLEFHHLGYRYGVTKCRHRVDPSGRMVHKLGPAHNVVEVDQVEEAVRDIRRVISNPFDRARRRIIISLWNPAQTAAMALPPCHTFSFFDMEPPASVFGLWTLSLHLCARSIDAVKGLPFNVASYALFCHVMAAVTGCDVGTLTITMNDCHVYDNQFADVEQQLAREPYPLPRLQLTDGFFGSCRDLSIAEAHELTPSMFRLAGYKHHERLQSESEVAV